MFVLKRHQGNVTYHHAHKSNEKERNKEGSKEGKEGSQGNTKEERNKEYLNIEKERSERFAEIPVVEDSTKYRKIVTINQE